MNQFGINFAAALYARVSTTDKGQDPEVQLRELREYCDRRKWRYEIFVDPGQSGAKVSRPQLDRLMQECRRKKFDVVVVYRFDRFARSTKHLVDALEEFRALGIQFVSLHEQVDTTTPMGRLAFMIFAAIGEFERELIRERVRSGLATARARGMRLGRPRADVDVGQIGHLRRLGLDWSAIAKKLGVGRNTVRRAFLAAQKPASLTPQ
jgi:DNA invertase Pin-like site-specific DNA recombinase